MRGCNYAWTFWSFEANPVWSVGAYRQTRSTPNLFQQCTWPRRCWPINQTLHKPETLQGALEQTQPYQARLNRTAIWARPRDLPYHKIFPPHSQMDVLQKHAPKRTQVPLLRVATQTREYAHQSEGRSPVQMLQTWMPWHKSQHKGKHNFRWLTHDADGNP